MMPQQLSRCTIMDILRWFPATRTCSKIPRQKITATERRLDDIVALYRFDEQLRELTLRYLLQVERHIRSAYSYAFCSQFGESQNSYLDANNYNLMGRINPREVQKLITRHLQPFLSHTTDYPYIEHHKQVHGNVPLWVLINALTFGTLSKMYALSQSKIQAAISKEFVGVGKTLGSMLEVLTKFRNVCAHNERFSPTTQRMTFRTCRSIKRCRFRRMVNSTYMENMIILRWYCLSATCCQTKTSWHIRRS